MSENNGGPAFPCEQHETHDGNWNQTFEPGMTLRDYFAAKAIPAIYRDMWEDVRAGRNGSVPEDWMMGIAVDAYRMADAMLKARGES